MTDQEIIEHEEVITADLKNEIESAMAERHRTGLYADPVWFAGLKKKLRLSQLRLKAAASRRRRDRKSRVPVGELFIKAARSALDPEVFSELLRQATEEALAV